MIYRTHILATALLVLACSDQPSTAKRIAKRDYNPKIPSQDRFNFFDLELLQSVTAATPGNVVVSPVSVKATLAMILEGAGGRSAEQIRTALRLPENPSAIQTVLHTYLTSLLTKDSGYKVVLSNRMFMSRALLPNPQYASSLQKYYYADIEKVDFASPEYTANNINKWVREITHGLIPQLVEPGNLQPDAQVLLANAVYFKGKWQTQFDTQGTTPRCFYTAPGYCRNANMMETLSEYGYAYVQRLDAYALEMPYKGEKFAMVIVMPNEVEGMNQLVRDILHVPLHDIVASLQTSDVLVSIPRFSVDFSTDLVATLHGLGIKDIFGPHSNLTGLFAGSEASAQVSNVFHKAKVIVNEEGSEAAAGTGAQVIPLMGSSIPKFRADRPFLFFIRDVTTGVVLFAGRVTEPEFTQQQKPPQQVEESVDIPSSTYRPTTSRRPSQSRPNNNNPRRTSTVRTTTQGTETLNSFSNQDTQSKPSYNSPQQPSYAQVASNGQSPTTSQNFNSQNSQNTNTKNPQNSNPQYSQNSKPQQSQNSNTQSQFGSQQPSNSHGSNNHNTHQYEITLTNSQNTPRPSSNKDNMAIHYPEGSAVVPYSNPQQNQNTGNQYPPNAQNTNVVIPLTLSAEQYPNLNSRIAPRSNQNANPQYSSNVQSQFAQNSEVHRPSNRRDSDYANNQNTNQRQVITDYDARTTQSYGYPTQTLVSSVNYVVDPSQLSIQAQYIPANDPHLTNTRNSFQASGGPARQYSPVEQAQGSSNYQQPHNRDRDAIVFSHSQRREQQQQQR